MSQKKIEITTIATTATTKSFVIPHPTKPGKRLVYGVIEGPEHSVFIRGVTTDAVIYLPDYWVNLIDENTITVQLTPIGVFQKLTVTKVTNKAIYIKNENTFSKNINCYFYIQAERKDIPKLEVEV